MRIAFLSVFLICGARSAEAGTTYYVDSAGGNDANSGTSTAAPWRTIGKVKNAALGPGDTVLLKRGGVWREQLTVNHSGAAGNPITYADYGSGNKPLLIGADLLSSGWTLGGTNQWGVAVSQQPNQVFFNGVRGTPVTSLAGVTSPNTWYWDSTSKLLRVYSASNPATAYTNPGVEAQAGRSGVDVFNQGFITLRNIAVTRNDYGLVLHGGAPNNLLDSVEASYSFYDGIGIQDAGSVNNSVINCIAHDTLRDGVLFWDGADKGTISGGTYYNNPESGAEQGLSAGGTISQVTAYNNTYGVKAYGGAGAESTTANITIQNNTAYGNSSFGIDVDYAGPGIIVQNNTSYSNASHGIAIEGTTAGAIVRYNITHGNGGGQGSVAGIILDGTTSVQVYYNILYAESIGVWTLGSKNPVIYNNTVYNSDTCVGIENATTGAAVKNNIGAGCRTYIVLLDTDSQSGMVFNNNDWVVSGAAVLQRQNTSYNLAGWKSATGQDQNSISIDPRFVNPSGNDFHLQSSSPAINVGTNVGLTADFGGAAVPQGAGVDLGAYEYSGGVTPPPGVSGLSCSPGSIVTPGTTSCTITLAGAAPGGGVAVTVTSGNGSATLSSPVTVPSGQTSAGFTVTGTAVGADTTALLTASANGTSAQFSLGLLAPIGVSSLTCNPTLLGAGASTNCTVTLTRNAPAGGAPVTISSNNPALSYGSPVTVPANSSSAGFTVSAAAVAVNQQATLSAAVGSSSQGVVLSLAAPAWLSSLACAPGTVTGGNAASCTVTLALAAPAGGLGVGLSSNNGAVSVPASVTVGVGKTSASFSAGTSAVSSQQTATVTATVNGQPATATVTVLPPATLSPSLTCASATLFIPGSVGCTAGLSGPAPAGGMTVTLNAAPATVTIPGSVNFSSGATTAGFTASAGAGATPGPTTLTASMGSSSANFQLTTMLTAVTSLVCNPTKLTGSGSTTCTVTISPAATGTGTNVTVSSSSSQLTVSSPVAVAGGSTTAQFTAKSTSISSDQSAVLTASLGSSSGTATINLVGVRPATLTCSPTTVIAGSTSKCQLSLNVTAPNSVTVSLSSNNSAALSVRSSVTFRKGQSTLSFTATSHTVSLQQTAVITASYGKTSVQTTISVTPKTAGAVTRLPADNGVADQPLKMPTLSGIVNAASYDGRFACSPGAIATLFGAGLADGPAQASEGASPTELSGVRVKVNGDYAPVFYASPTQVNFRCPDLPVGTALSLTVDKGADSTNPITTSMQYAAPGIFTLDGAGRGQGAIFLAGTQEFAMLRDAIVPSTPAVAGEIVTIFATGLGPLTGGAWLETSPVVTMAGVPAEVQFAGPAPGRPGLYQLSVKVPASATAGDQIPVSILVTLPGGQVAASNSVTMAIEELR